MTFKEPNIFNFLDTKKCPIKYQKQFTISEEWDFSQYLTGFIEMFIYIYSRKTPKSAKLFLLTHIFFLRRFISFHQSDAHCFRMHYCKCLCFCSQYWASAHFVRHNFVIRLGVFSLVNLKLIWIYIDVYFSHLMPKY